MKTKRTQTASHWGVYEVETDIKSGEVVGAYPSAMDPSPSQINASLPETVNDYLRIDRPYVREGYLIDRSGSRTSRGRDRFVPISWDQALELISDTIVETRETYGNRAIYGGSYGWASAGRFHHAPSVLKRFLSLCGGYSDKIGNHSFGAALGIVPYILGRDDIEQLVVRWPDIVEHTECVVMFGGVGLKNSDIDSGGIVAHEVKDWLSTAVDAGVKFVNISPFKNDMAYPVEAEWIPIRPNTDAALMLGVMHTLVTENKHDRAFLNTHCRGSSELISYLLGNNDGCPKDIAWAANITGIPETTIYSLALKMHRLRTLVTGSWSIQRAEHGEQSMSALIALASVLGEIGLPGRGFSIGLGSTGASASPRPDDIPMPKLKIPANPVDFKMPVGRTADLYLNPGGYIEYQGDVLEIPDVKLVYSAGGNPFHHNLNLNRFLRGWQKLNCVIVHEPWWSPPAKFADIVIPSTTTMERNDIQSARSSRYWIAMHKVLEPHKKARNDFDVFSELSERLGFGASYHENRTEYEWLEYLYTIAAHEARTSGYDPPDFGQFWDDGYFEFESNAGSKVLFEEFRSYPSGCPLNTPSGRIELFSEQLHELGYDECPPNASWIEPSEWLGGDWAKQYPLHLLTSQPSTQLHSQMNQSRLSRTGEVHERQAITINVLDAQARGINDGDIVRVFNDRGELLAGAYLVGSDVLLQGVVRVATGAWYDPVDGGTIGSLEKHGNPNVVTSDKGSSRLSQSPAAQSCLVEISRFDTDETFKVTAFELPEIVVYDTVPCDRGLATDNANPLRTAPRA